MTKPAVKAPDRNKARPDRISLGYVIVSHGSRRALGEVLRAKPWWRLSSGHVAVNAFCPRFGRGVVLRHLFAAVPRPVGKE